MLIALWINLTLSLSETYWISLSAFFAWQTTEGAPFRHAIIFFLIMTTAMLIALGLPIIIANKQTILFLLATVYVLSAYAFFLIYYLAPPKSFFMFLFLAVWLIVGLSPFIKPVIVENLFLDILIGTTIGAIGKTFIFPSKAEDKFRLEMIPLLKTLENCTSLICTYFLQSENENVSFKPHQMQIQHALQAQQGKQLEWVFDAGFNPKLRAGYRFFLIHLEWVIEIVLSMSYLLSQSIEQPLLQNLRHDLYHTMQNNQMLMTFLLQYFENKKMTEMPDLKNDLIDLKTNLQRHVPVNLELLDISPDYIFLTALVSEIKDLRGRLLELVLALPNQAPHLGAS